MLSFFNFKKKIKIKTEKQKLISFDLCHNCSECIEDKKYDVYQICDKLDIKQIICCSEKCKNDILKNPVIHENDAFIRRNKFTCHQCCQKFYIPNGITEYIDDRYYNTCNPVCLYLLKKELII